MVMFSYMLVIVDEFECQGMDFVVLSLQIGIFGVELWMFEMCSVIEVCMGFLVVDIYGLLEVMGLGVVSECVEIKDGLIIWEDYFYLEIIDFDFGEVLFDGEFGELVFMLLIKEVMLVVCYCMCDLMWLLFGMVCLGFCCMEKIIGCCDDMMIVCGVNVFLLQIEELILKYVVLLLYYQCVFGKEGLLDMLMVWIEVVLGVLVDVV